jgi:NAD(P)-dependent dehydrogenase (short-subunit alcohol dehydrogenase family)
VKSLKELMNLQGRVALITGGAGHIGLAIGEALAELGAAVAVLDMAGCEAAAERLRDSYGVNTLPVQVDLNDEAVVRGAPEMVVEKLGRLDILVNCAGFGRAAKLDGWVTPFEQQSAETWRKALEINLTASFVLTQACTPALRASGHGSVVNISSIYGMVGPDMRLYEGSDRGNPAAYAASKGGLLQMTRWLATVLAPDIRVNAITPGGVWRNQPQDFLDRYNARTPMGRMATEEDLKGAAAYLASDLSAYVTGHNLVVDGGWTVW